MTDSMARIRDEVTHQLGTPDSVDSSFDPAAVVRFSADLPERLSPEEREGLVARARDLEPWLQGPFLLGGDLVVGGVCRIDSRWETLGREIPDVTGLRVLDVGSNAGYDPFMFSLRGAGEVLACEPFEFIEQARFLESLYRTGVDFRQIGWQELSAEEHGQFDFVHCHGVLYHEVDPIGLLQRLHEMTKPGGTLVIGSMMLADPLFAELSRFVPRAYFRDDTWWWVPGPVALRTMIESVGFEVDHYFGESEGPAGEFATINGYFRASRPRDARARFNCGDQANWEDRARSAVALLKDNEKLLEADGDPLAIADFGAGNERLRPLLDSALTGEHRYLPFDLHPQLPTTERLDVSEGLPAARFDLGICLGLLEYLDELPAFLDRLAGSCRFALVSYVTSDSPEAMPRQQRLERNWASHLTHAEVEAAFAAAGLSIVDTAGCEEGVTTLWLLRQ